MKDNRKQDTIFITSYPDEETERAYLIAAIIVMTGRVNLVRIVQQQVKFRI